MGAAGGDVMRRRVVLVGGASQPTRRAALRGAIAATAFAAPAALVAACGSAAGGGAASNASAAPVTLTMHARSNDDGTHFQRRADAFQAANPTTTVKLELTASGEYDTKIATLQASGSLGDTLWANQVGPFFPLAAANVTRQLDDLAKRDKYDLGQHIPATIEQLRWKGQLRGLPWLVHAGWSGLFVNGDSWSRAGQPVPSWDWTYETDFVAAGRKLARPVGDPRDVWAFEVPFSMQAAITFLRSWGTDLLSDDGKKSLLNQPKAIAALTFAHDLMNVQKASPRPDQSVASAFQMGKSLSWMTGYFSLAQVRQQSSFTWRAYPMPKGPGGRGAFLGDDAVSMNAASKSVDAAWKWLRFLASKETGLLVAQDRGSPGGRNDVWDDPALMADPNHQMFREWMKLVKSVPIPANARMVDLTNAANAGLKDLYNEKKAPTQAIADLHLSVQNVLDS
jgi:ABC-type glycerol-3-phosphate transport system substrate-binding protein